MRKCFIILLGASAAMLLGTFVFTKSSDTPTSLDVWKVGTNAEYPPYCYIDQNQIVGFDMDVVQEVAQRLGKKLIFCDMPFDALIPSLKLHQIDCIAAGLTATDERAKNVSFTKPYLEGDSLVVVSFAEQPILELDALKGKCVAVNEGYLSDLFLSNISGIDLVRLPSPADGFLALASRKVSAFVTVQTTATSFMQQYPQNAYVVSKLGNISEGVSMAVAKDRRKELQEIQEILDQMIQDQTMLRIQKKWGL